RPRADTMTMLLVANRGEQETLRQDIKDYSKEGDESLRRLLDRSRNDPERLRKFEELRDIRDIFKEVRDTKTIPLILEGKPESLKEAKDLQPEQNKRYNKMRGIIHELATDSERAAQAVVGESVE